MAYVSQPSNLRLNTVVFILHSKPMEDSLCQIPVAHLDVNQPGYKPVTGVSHRHGSSVVGCISVDSSRQPVN